MLLTNKLAGVSLAKAVLRWDEKKACQEIGQPRRMIQWKITIKTDLKFSTEQKL